MMTDTINPPRLRRVGPPNANRDRRRNQRVRVSLAGRYMLEDRREFVCQTLDISPGGVALLAPLHGPLASRVVVYIDQLGRVEGIIARLIDGGFALSLQTPLLKREKLADRITWLANRHDLGMPEDLRHERIVPSNARSTLKLLNGHEYLIGIRDISRSGVAVIGDVRIPIGTAVIVGNTRGQVVRLFADGLAVEFQRTLSAETFDENVRI